MLRSTPVAGFSLAYERRGTGPPVVLLHGWPGDHGNYPLPGVGHFSPLEAPDRFAQAIRDAA